MQLSVTFLGSRSFVAPASPLPLVLLWILQPWTSIRNLHPRSRPLLRNLLNLLRNLLRYLLNHLLRLLHKALKLVMFLITRLLHEEYLHRSLSTLRSTMISMFLT